MKLFSAISPYYSQRLIGLALLLSGVLHWLLLQWPAAIQLAGQPHGDTRYSVSLRYEAIAKSESQIEKVPTKHKLVEKKYPKQKEDSKKVINEKVINEKVVKETLVKEKAILKQSSEKVLAKNISSASKLVEKKSVVEKLPVEQSNDLPVTKVVTVENQLLASRKKQSKPSTEAKAKAREVRDSSSQQKLASSNDQKLVEKIKDVADSSELNENNLAANIDEKTESENDDAHIQPVHYQIGSASNPKPYYPAIARKRGWEGDVVLGVNVAADGSIDSLIIIKGATYSALTHAAWETVKEEWSFKAAIKEGQAIASYIEVPISFRLTN